MGACPRLEIDLAAIQHNTAVLVGRLRPHGIGVTAVTKALMGEPAVARAMLDAGAVGLGDSRVSTLEGIGDMGAPLTLLRAPAPSEVERVVATGCTSVNTEPVVLEMLSTAAVRLGVVHDVVLMVELGDLREGLMPEDVLDVVGRVCLLPGLDLAGIGTNLACRSGVAPDATNMAVLSGLAIDAEAVTGAPLRIVSGGNSASLSWALGGAQTGRVNDLRIGEAILLGVDPLDRTAIPGLRTDAFTLVAEVIESKRKPSRPWGTLAQSAFGVVQPSVVTGSAVQSILAVGRQDTDPDGLTAPEGMTVLAASSDHLVLRSAERLGIGAEVRFRPGYSALLRGTTSPFVQTCLR